MLISPEASTNIHCVENVLFIQWHVFGTDIPPDRRPFSTLSAFSTLDQAWSEFVQSGYHACHAFKVKLIWVFELSSTFSSSRTNKPPLSEIARKHQLKKISFGSLRACDLENLARGSQPSTTASQNPGQRSVQNGPASPVQDVQSPVTVDFDPKNDSSTSTFQPSPKLIYDAFITATYDLFISTLISSLHIIPLSANFFVQTRVQRYVGTNPVTHAQGATGPPYTQPYITIQSACSVGVEWLSNGKLFIAACPARTSLRPISTCLRKYDWFPWCDCYIAPFGIRLPAGSVWRKRADTDDRHQPAVNKPSQRQSIISVLERRGINIPGDEEWVTCKFPGEAENLPAVFHGRFLMWPCSLVYVCDQSSCPADVGKCVSPQAFTDAFATTGGTIDHAFAKPPQTTQRESRQSHAARDPYLHILDNLPGAGGGSGVYPTPPDMLRSHPASQLHRASAFSAPTPATVSSMPAPGDGETPSMAHDLMMSPDDDVDIKLGDDADHDDLFGDLAIGLGTDVLNEDEFGFFDMQRPLTGKSTMSTENTPSSGTQLTGADQPASSPPLPQLRKVSDISASTVRSGSSDRPSGDQEDIEMQDNLIQSAPRAITSSPESVRDVARRQPPTLDEKYANGGIYSTTKPTASLSKKPTVSTPAIRTIPIITKPNYKHHLSDTSSDDSSEDSDYMDDDDDDNDEDDNDHDFEDEDEDDDYDTGNLHDDSDTSMEGVEGTPSSSMAHASRSKPNPQFMLPVEELAKARLPMLICPTRLGPKGETNKIMVSLGIRPDQYIELAQLVAEQLCYYEGGLSGMPQRTNPDQPIVLRTIGTLFDKPTPLDIESCASVARASKQQLDSPFSPSLPSDDTSYQLPTSDVVIERDGSRMVVSATALSIWVELGLTPSGGQQDVQCYCFTPDAPPWLHGSKGLLEMLHDTFASMRLGRHDLGTVGAFNSLKLDGLVGIEAADSFQQFKINLAKAANNFDKLIRSSDLEEHTDVMVIYIVNPAPPEETSVLPALCSVFQKIQHTLQEHDITLVLKIVPGSLVAQDNALSVPTPDALIRLAREMYERISQADGPPSPLTHLAPPLPTAVPMRLESNPSRRPLDSDTILHLAYSWTPASPWLTFALTDALGKTKYSSSYFVPWRPTTPSTTTPNPNPSSPNPGTPNPNTPSQPPTPGGPVTTPSTTVRTNPWTKDNAMGRFVEAIKHLWSSLDKLFPQPKSGMHKLIIVKDSPPVHAQEVHVWKMLAQSRANMELVFLIIDPECPITLIDPPRSSRRTGTDDTNRMDTSGVPASSSPNTPLTSTLAAAGTTPYAGPNLTPGASSIPEDHGARLVRARDEVWAVEARTVFAVTPVGKLEIIPGVGGCGYMVSRDPGPSPDAYNGRLSSEDGGSKSDGATVVSVRVQFAKAGPLGVNMREIMNAFRGLTTVSEVVGLETRLPWHVAVARRARIGLSRCM